MSSSQQSSANAVGGKTARACDSCMRRRARWYCAADDAFLCQTCDSTVHSANPLARRHIRVLLKTASAKCSLSPASSDLNSALPSWHQGFKRKARTPRHGKSSTAPVVNKPAPLVPDLENNEDEEEEEQLLYCVPIFDPVLEKFYSPQVADEADVKPVQKESQVIPMEEENANETGNGFAGFNPSDMELAEFAADMESLLGQGMEDDSFCIDGIGGFEGIGEEEKNQVKMEEADSVVGNIHNNNTDILVDTGLEFNFGCRESPEMAEGEDDKVGIRFYGIRNNNDYINNKVGLKLDYDAVMAEWSCQGCSPWTDGERPQFNPDDYWPDFMGIRGVGGEVQGGGYGEGRLLGPMGQVGGNGDDGGREARVSRYREKRRTRLFSKKIRYEVRKLNAEKRPRMKGRFVKRASFLPPTASAVAANGPAGFPYV